MNRKKNIKILIVDDNKSFRDILTITLSLEGFMVEGAGNGKEALDKVSRDIPDLILLDCIMPVMDGFETYRELKGNPKTENIPIIFCSATDIEEIKKRKIKADGYIEKPFTVESLFRKIDKIIKNKE
ncbi:MAG: response regulator [Candidatus Omnitrophota bacterium]